MSTTAKHRYRLFEVNQDGTHSDTGKTVECVAAKYAANYSPDIIASVFSVYGFTTHHHCMYAQPMGDDIRIDYGSTWWVLKREKR